MLNRILKAAKAIRMPTLGGEDPKPSKPTTPPPSTTLSPKQRQEWNQYVDFVASKGYKGSPLLDKKETGLAKNLFDEFKKTTGATINYEDVATVQNEMERLKQSAQGFAQRRNDPNAKSIMTGISKVDGWPGSRTTQFKFPDIEVTQYRNNNLVAKKNYGLLNGNLEAEGVRKSIIPKNIKTEPLYDSSGNQIGMGYVDPKTGDIVEVK